jgi:hypothetical protein
MRQGDNNNRVSKERKYKYLGAIYTNQDQYVKLSFTLIAHAILYAIPS